MKVSKYLRWDILFNILSEPGFFFSINVSCDRTLKSKLKHAYKQVINST